MRVFVWAVSIARAAFDRHCNDSASHHGSMSTAHLSAHWYVFKTVSSQTGRDRRESVIRSRLGAGPSAPAPEPVRRRGLPRPWRGVRGGLTAQAWVRCAWAQWRQIAAAVAVGARVPPPHAAACRAAPTPLFSIGMSFTNSTICLASTRSSRASELASTIAIRFHASSASSRPSRVNAPDFAVDLLVCKRPACLALMRHSASRFRYSPRVACRVASASTA